MCSKQDVKGVMSQCSLMELRVCFDVFLYNETRRSQDVSVEKDDVLIHLSFYSPFWNVATHTVYPPGKMSGTNECTLQWKTYAFYQLFNILSWYSVIAAVLHHWLNLFHHSLTHKGEKTKSRCYSVLKKDPITSRLQVFRGLGCSVQCQASVFVC